MSNPRVTYTIEPWGKNGAFKATIFVDGPNYPVAKSYHATRAEAQKWCDIEIAWRGQEVR